MPAPTPVEKRQLYRGNDPYIKEMPEIIHIVDGLLTEGLGVLASRPKDGKSWLALHLALAISGATPFLGVKTGPEPGKVLLLALEESPAEIKSRLTHLGYANQVPAGFCFTTEWEPFDQGGIEGLEEIVQSPEFHGLRLIIIDTLGCVQPSQESNDSYRADMALYVRLRSFAKRHHLAILLVHHNRKASATDPMDAILGSRALTGAADTIWCLDKNLKSDYASLKVSGRNVKRAELGLAFNAGRWKLISKTEKIQEPDAPKGAQREILNLFRGGKHLTPKEVSELSGKNYSTTRGTLAKLVEKKHLLRLESGQYSLPPKLPVAPTV